MNDCLLDFMLEISHNFLLLKDILRHKFVLSLEGVFLEIAGLYSFFWSELSPFGDMCFLSFTYIRFLFYIKGIISPDYICSEVIVLYPEKGACADPVDKGAILGEGGPSPHSSDRERQLAPDIGRGET